MKVRRIHSPAPQAGVGDTPTMKGLLINPGRAQYPVRLTVKPTEIMPADPDGPLHAIALGILLVVGMGRRHDRESKLPGSLEPGQPDGELSNHMDNVGLKFPEIVDNVTESGKGPLHVLI